MSLKQKAAKGIAWSFIQRWGSQLISFTVFTLLARLLQPEDFGLIAMSGVFIAFMKVFLDQGFASAIVQREELEREHLDTAFWVSIVTSLLLIGVSWALAGAIASFYREPLLLWVIRLLSLSFLFKALNSVQNAILTRKLAFKTLAVRSLIGIALGGAVGITMALMGFGVWSLVGYQTATSVIEVPVLWAVSNWRPGLTCSMRHFKELFDFGIHVIGMNGLVFLNNYSDNLLIGYFLGTEALGYYTIAYRVLTVLTTLLSKTTNQVAFPAFSRLQQDPERLQRAFYKATELSSLIAFPCFLGIAALAPEIVPTLFGEQWTPSIPVMQVLTLIGILRTVFQFNGPIMMAMGRPDWRFKINIVNTVLNVACFVVVVRWGIMAVAIAFVVRSYLFAPVGLWLIQKLIRIRLGLYLRQFLAPTLGSVLMVAAILGTKHLLASWLSPWGLLLVGSVVGTAVYGATIALVAPEVFGETVSFIQAMLPKSKRKKKRNVL